MVESKPGTSAAATRSSPPAPSCHWVSVGENAASFFPRLVGAPCQTEASTDLVQITDTDLDAEPLLESRLHHTAWRARCRMAVVLQPDPLVRSQFSRVTMPAILESNFSASTHLAQ